jgi:GNAT superfamily N-acetyltransferase
VVVDRVVALSSHEIPDRPPIQLEVGERVEVGDRDDEWPAFVFVRAERGSGWVPARHLDRQGAVAVVAEAYDTAELPTHEGEELEVLRDDALSGWLWCRAADGREGWVPQKTLHRHDDSTRQPNQVAPRLIRPARDDEGPELTELALRAKSHWGYTRGFLEAARADLTIDEDTVRDATILVLERAGSRLGFYGVIGAPPVGRLEWMFLEPDAIGQGYGRVMWNHAIAQAKELGFSRLVIESDRYAEPFYLAMGAQRIGEAPSPVDGAALPMLELRLTDPPSATVQAPDP